MGGSSGKTTTVQQADPWIGVQEPLQNYFQALGDWFYNPQVSQPGYGGYTQPTQTATELVPGVDYGSDKDRYMMNRMQEYTGNLPFLPDNVRARLFSDLTQRTTESGLTPQELQALPSLAELKREDWQQAPMVAPQSPLTRLAQSLMTQRALGGGGLMGQAQETIAQGLQGYNPAMSLMYPTASGAMMDQDFNRFYQQAAGKVGEQFQNITMPAIASRYSLAGRTGSGAEQQAYQGAMGQLGQTLGGLATDIYGQERGRQMQAAQSLGDMFGEQSRARLQYSLAAPQYAYADIAPLFDIGQQQQAYQQSLIDAPLRRLQAVAPMLQPGLGFGSQTMTTPTYSNPATGAMGGAISGGVSTGSPWGALAGAVLGYMAQQQ